MTIPQRASPISHPAEVGKPRVIVLCGPTAAGKTAAGIEVARAVSDQIRRDGRMEWSWTGLQLQPLKDFNINYCPLFFIPSFFPLPYAKQETYHH